MMSLCSTGGFLLHDSQESLCIDTDVTADLKENRKFSDVEKTLCSL